MNLIPFAYLASTSELVDVADVPSGRSCQCICPSCKIPLVARKGDVNEWHFAHDSKFIEKEQKHTCDFSWEIALKMMLKQLLMKGDKIFLPNYNVEYSAGGYQNSSQQLLVTTSAQVSYQKPILNKFGCDIVLDVQSKNLGIVFNSRKNKRKASSSSMEVATELVGLIAIDVNDFAFNENEKVTKHWLDFLKVSIETQAKAKFWLYHAREKMVLEKAQEKAEAERQQRAKEQEKYRKTRFQYKNSNTKVKKAKEAKKAKKVKVTYIDWHCIDCEHTYKGESIGLNPCPKCNSYLYRTTLK